MPDSPGSSLRNYVQLFFGVVFYNNIANPPPNFPLFDVKGSLEELNAELDLIEADITPPQEVRGREVLGSRYVLLDKYNVQNMIGTGYLVPLMQGTPGGMQAVDQQTGFIYPDNGDTPRNGWKDGTGVTHKAPPTDKRTKVTGSKRVAPETLIQSLLTFLQTLILAGEKNVPGSLTAQLITFIQNLKLGRPINEAKLNLLLQQIDSLLNK